MSTKRNFAVSTLVFGLMAANIATLAGPASAQERSNNGTGQARGGRPSTPTVRPTAPAPRIVTPAPRVVIPAPRIATPAPRVVAPAPQIARQPLAHWPRATPRYVAPAAPVVRHAEPRLEYRPEHRNSRSHEGPRRGWGGWGWRPWGYGAAAVGTVIVGRAIIASAPRSSLQACANDFEGFDWDTGTIINSYGDREVCPYLEQAPAPGPERFND